MGNGPARPNIFIDQYNIKDGGGKKWVFMTRPTNPFWLGRGLANRIWFTAPYISWQRFEILHDIRYLERIK